MHYLVHPYLQPDYGWKLDHHINQLEKVEMWCEEPDHCWIIEYSGESTVSKLEQIEWVNELDEDENFPIIGSLKMTFSLLIQDYAE